MKAELLEIRMKYDDLTLKYDNLKNDNELKRRDSDTFEESLTRLKK